MHFRLLLMLMSFPAAATAQQPLTVFGIPIDASLSVPECPWKMGHEFYDTKKDPLHPVYTATYSAPESGPCFLQITKDTGQPLHDGSKVSIIFPAGKDPTLGKPKITIAGGKVAYMEINTRGVNTQELDMMSLVEKFGSPTKQERPSVQNRMGATFETISATWSLPNSITVEYASALTTINEGIITISTPIGRDAEKQRVMERLKAIQGTGL